MLTIHSFICILIRANPLLLVHSHQVLESPREDDSHDNPVLGDPEYDQEEAGVAEVWAPEGEAS